MSQLPGKNLTNELAKERNRAAAERTLLAWIRTSLSLIGFGFGIDQVVAAIDRSFDGTVDEVRLARLLGLMFIAVGIYAIVTATLEHRRELKRIQRDDYLYVSRRSNGVVVATSLMLIGAFAFIMILIRTLT
jgi:putative membrane protein